MKKVSYKLVLVLYGALFLLSLLIIFGGIVLVGEVITVTDPNGNRVKSNWPQAYTREFEQFFTYDQDRIIVSEAGLKSLDDNHLWMQIIDENGNVEFAYHTTDTQALHYSPIEFLQLYQGQGSLGETVHAGTVESDQYKWTYIIGFPMNITKITMHLNGDGFTDGKSFLLVFLFVSALLIFLSGGIFGVWIIRHMRKITQAVGQIPYRRYRPIQDTGVFQTVYDSLNDMNQELLESDREQARNEKMREEWITNITHDLKTPLSPIKGYAELLSDSGQELPEPVRIRYGQTILRNAAYAERLVNDLKLTYQLKNDMIPLDKKMHNLTLFLKELIIEILNHPEYSDRVIAFDTDKDAAYFRFDEGLLKRAIDNLIYNALVHNPDNTEIQVSLQTKDDLVIIISDNGNGMTAEQIERLFERYCRGINTSKNIAGSGLGMAIAKQIIEIHGGNITVESELDAGTKIAVTFSEV